MHPALADRVEAHTFDPVFEAITAVTSVLTINAGSSSVRLALFDAADRPPRVVQRAHHSHVDRPEAALLRETVSAWLPSAPALIAHRVVHGGARFVQPCRIDPAVEQEIERLGALAPLHNPAALRWLRACREVFGADIAQIAVFDTAFYSHLPEVAASYALPHALCRQQGLRRYGFHGIAHAALWQRWRALVGADRAAGRVISLQLGAGCSVTAIRQGVAVDTSMGFSPLEGLMMATRCGDIDPGLVLHLQRAVGMTVDAVERLLNHDSGLLGVSGLSAEMQQLLESAEPRARLAVDMFCYRARKYVGAYCAVLGGVDAILFGGGVGENSPAVRSKILQGLEFLGVRLDAGANNAGLGRECCISAATAIPQVWVIPVDEAAEIARAALAAPIHL